MREFSTTLSDGCDVTDIPLLSVIDGEFELRASFAEKDLCKQIPGYRFVKHRAAWRYPITPASVVELDRCFPHAQLTQEARIKMHEHLALARNIVAMKEKGYKGAVPIMPMPISVEPFEHQILGFNIGIQLPNVAYLMAMGTGKSLTALSVLGARFLAGDIDRVLIVAPSSVVPVWEKEFAQFADFPHKVTLLHGPITKRIKQLEQATDTRELTVMVTNYEAVWRKYFYDALADFVTGFPVGSAIVCDESQRIKTPGSAQSKALHKLGKIADYRFILTGTPITNHPIDFFSQYKFLDSTIFGNVFSTFRNKYTVMGGFENREIVDYQNLEDLERRAHSVSYRVRKDECLDLPPALASYRYCELEAKAKSLYRVLKREAVADLGEAEISTTNVLTKLLRLQQLTGGFITDDDGKTHNVSDAKLKVLYEVIGDAIHSGEKLVVFARFRAEIEAIVANLERSNIKHCLIWGDTPMQKRGDIVEEFQTDDEVKVFVAQIQTAGLGITLTAASIAVFYSLDFNFANYDQALARIDRIGQTKSITNIHIVAKDTIDDGVLQVLQRKRNVADAVVDGGWRDLIEGRVSVPVSAFGKSDASDRVDR